MSKKSHAFPLLRAFILLIEKEFPIHLQSIGSDNYMVFSEKNATNSYESNGIIHQVSCVEGQEENYVVEAKHKDLLEVARAFFLNSVLPPHSFLGGKHSDSSLPKK